MERSTLNSRARTLMTRNSILSGDPFRIWSIWAPTSLAFFFWWSQALYGFNPTDDGFILGQAWRILHGERPHVDFTSPRPVGSAILHLPEVALPVGQLAISRLVVTFELLWIAIASVDIALAYFGKITPIQRFLLCTTAFFVNIGAWPIMPWHTIDGLFLGLTAIHFANAACRSTSRDFKTWLFVWIVAGSAPITKQGFLIVPFLVGVNVVAKRNLRALMLSPLALLPGLLYWMWVGNQGLRQIHSGSSSELLEPIRSLISIAQTPAGLSAVVSVALAFLVVMVSDGAASINTFVGSGLIAIPVLISARHQMFALAGPWCFIAVVVLAISGILWVRNLDYLIAHVQLVGLAYAVAISWGVPAPSLLAGSSLVVALITLWANSYSPHEGRPQTNLTYTAALFLIMSFTFVSVIHAREVSIYRERPRSELNYSATYSNFALIRLSLQSSKYLVEVGKCLKEFPAHSVAVLPDNAGIYPLLRLRNPFNTDWWLPQERSEDHENRVTLTIDRLNREGDWLVLFQSYFVHNLPGLTPEQVAAPGNPVAYVESDLSILDRLRGQPVRCGPFQGKYASGKPSL